MTRLILGGDVQLGRLQREVIERHGAEYPLAPVASLMRDADLALVNLECAITDSETLWHGAPKAFYFGAPPAAARTLAHAGVDLVSLANNHLLDSDLQGLRDTLRHLDDAGIAHAGAGETLAQARAPAVAERAGRRFGLVAWCDHQADFAATESRPGIAYVDLQDYSASLACWRQDMASLRARGVAWPMLSLHWGPNWADHPAQHFRALAHAAVDLGFRLVFGHSAHNFMGVELYHGGTIVYGAGDLVDDYAVDPYYRNDRTLLIEIDLDDGQVSSLRVHPAEIVEFQTRPARGAAFEFVAREFTRRCAALGTSVHRDGDRLSISAATESAAR